MHSIQENAWTHVMKTPKRNASLQLRKERGSTKKNQNQNQFLKTSSCPSLFIVNVCKQFCNHWVITAVTCAIRLPHTNLLAFYNIFNVYYHHNKYKIFVVVALNKAINFSFERFWSNVICIGKKATRSQRQPDCTY